MSDGAEEKIRRLKKQAKVKREQITTAAKKRPRCHRAKRFPQSKPRG